jgi:hypothetical protein
LRHFQDNSTGGNAMKRCMAVVDALIVGVLVLCASCMCGVVVWPGVQDARADDLLSVSIASLPAEASAACYIVVAVGSLPAGVTPDTDLLDTDCDGIPDKACPECSPPLEADNCPFTPNGPDLGTCIAGLTDTLGATCVADTDCGAHGWCSMAQEDADADGYGDACDYCVGHGMFDIDSDGLCDEEDNCPTAPNPGQEDSDGNGYGDECSAAIDRIAPIGVFSGTWFEIGRQVGRAYPDNIIDFGQLFEFILGLFGPHGWSAQDFYNETEALIPQSVKDHMAGMAEGLIDVRPISPAIAWDLVLAQNMAVDLLNMVRNMSPVPDPEVDQLLNALRGCTGFAVSSAAGTYLAHNTDAQGVAGVNISVIMYWHPTNGDYAYLTFDPPGWADAAFALNQKGIGVTVNAGAPNSDAVIGYYYTFMTRYAMEHAATLDEAVAVFEDVFARGETFGPTGALIHFVDFNTGRMAKIQLRSESMEVSYGEERVPGVISIGSANHFVGDFNPDPSYYYESSWMRYDRLLDLLNDGAASFDLGGSWDILRDTNDGLADDNTISKQGGFGGSSTTFGTVFTEDGMYYALGRPDAYFMQYPEAQFVPAVCALSIRHKPISAHKLTRPRKRVLHISGTGLDIHAQIDLGPLTWRKVRFNSKKNRLKVTATIPAGLEPGAIQVRVGNCVGVLEIR